MLTITTPVKLPFSVPASASADALQLYFIENLSFHTWLSVLI